jgi:hypothetical protein
MTTSQRKRLPDNVADAMAAVIEFFWMDEAKDYLARDREGQKEHIFNEMLTVRQWLAGRQPKRGRLNEK